VLTVAVSTQNQKARAIQLHLTQLLKAVLNGGGGRIVGTTANAAITLKFR